MKSFFRKILYTKKHNLSNYSVRYPVVLVNDKNNRRNTFLFKKIIVTSHEKSEKTGETRYFGYGIEHGFFNDEVVKFEDFTLVGKIFINIINTLDELYNPHERIAFYYLGRTIKDCILEKYKKIKMRLIQKLYGLSYINIYNHLYCNYKSINKNDLKVTTKKLCAIFKNCTLIKLEKENETAISSRGLGSLLSHLLEQHRNEINTFELDKNSTEEAKKVLFDKSNEQYQFLKEDVKRLYLSYKSTYYNVFFQHLI